MQKGLLHYLPEPHNLHHLAANRREYFRDLEAFCKLPVAFQNYVILPTAWHVWLIFSLFWLRANSGEEQRRNMSSLGPTGSAILIQQHSLSVYHMSS